MTERVKLVSKTYGSERPPSDRAGRNPGKNPPAGPLDPGGPALPTERKGIL